MTVKEAQEKIVEIERVENNLRLLEQYFLNVSPDVTEKIESQHGMNNTVLNTLADARKVLMELATTRKKKLDTTDIGDLFDS